MKKKKDKKEGINNFKDYKISIIQKSLFNYFLLTKEKSLLYIMKIKRLNINRILIQKNIGNPDILFNSNRF